jgi:NPCBM/NEW2 domain
MWKQLDEREVVGDVLIIAKREGGLLDYLTGVVGDASADEVTFEYEGQKLPVKRSKVAAIAYYHAEPRRLPEAICRLTLMDGSQIPAREVALVDDGQLQVRTPAGIAFSVSLMHVVRGDFSAGKLAYLSDLKPIELKWTPRIATSDAASLIAEFGQPRNNVSFSGSALSLAWPDESLPTGREIRTYARGLAIRSRTDLVYRLPEGMRRFTATAGIDPATAGQGHVVLEIRADDRMLWEDEIDGKQAPVEIDLDLGTARRLQFHVDYGRNLDYGDRLHLIEARVTK